jgi:hypothetical protein
MSTLVLLPGAGSEPAVPVLGPWITSEYGRPGGVIGRSTLTVSVASATKTASVVGRAVPIGSVAALTVTGSVVGRMRWSSVSSDWEVKL